MGHEMEAFLKQETLYFFFLYESFDFSFLQAVPRFVLRQYSLHDSHRHDEAADVQPHKRLV